jgi:hypothetical protein
VTPAIRLEDVRITAREGLRHQLQHPWEIPPQALRKIKNLYGDDSDGIRLIVGAPALDSTDPFVPVLTSEESRRWTRLADAYFYAAGAAALAAAALLLWRRDWGALVLLTAVLGWTLLFAFINPVSRFHFALGPVIALLAAVFVVATWDYMAGLRGRASS